MSENTWLIIAGIVIVILIAVAIWLAVRERNSKRLKGRFGPEYEREIKARGDRAGAEAELQQREKRVKGYDLRALSSEERARFVDQWRRIQGAFVDDPGAAIGDADRLIGEVMAARGYPSADFEQRSADISVDHAEVMHSYRSAHEIAVRHQKGEAGTEDLRQAMVSYRALFNELTGVPTPANEPARETPAQAEQKTEELTK